MQAQTRIADLYQTDMDRHLYAFEQRQGLSSEILGKWAEGVKAWMDGWARRRMAMAQGFFSIL
jgi:hypothetical protein